MKFLGWIPNLRGRLSFSTIGTSTKPYPFIKIIKEQHVEIVQSKRMLHDSAVPRVIRTWLFEKKFAPMKLFSGLSRTIEKLCNHSGDFKFSFYYKKLSETNSNGSIRGVVVVEALRDLPNTDEPVSQIAEKSLNVIVGKDACKILSSALVVVDVEINRDGFCLLECLSVRKIDRRNLKWTSNQGNGFNKFIEEAVCQAYFYIKDVCHQHQHHDSKTDNLLPLVQCHHSNINRSYEELAAKVFKALYRLVLKKRRSESIKDFHSMKGILCYLKSFRDITQVRKISVDNFKTSDDKHLIGSIEAKESCIRAGRERKNGFIGQLPSIGSLSVSLLALLFAFSSMVIIYTRPNDKIHKRTGVLSDDLLNTYIDFIELVIRYPMDFLLVPLISLLSFFYVNSDFAKESKFYNDMRRITFGFKNPKLIGGAIMLCSLIGFLYSFWIISEHKQYLLTKAVSFLKDLIVNSLQYITQLY